MKAIFDANIYELADCQIGSFKDELEHFNYLSDIIDFIKKEKLRVVCSLNEYLSIVNMKDHPWNQYKNKNDCKNLNIYSALPMVYFDLMNQISFEEGDESKIKPISLLNYCSSNKCICFNEFLKHIAFLKSSNQYAVFIGTANYNLDTPLKFELNDKEFDVEPIMNINDDDVKNFSPGYRNFLLCNIDIKPTLKNPLPNSDFCKQYKTWQENKINIGEPSENTYRKAVHEVALRNGYYQNERLSHLNSNSGVIRDIYTSNSKPVVHISADVRHGRIEVFNSLGKHQGEYSYIGKQLNPPDPEGKHDIKV